jgi:SSS family solute:Na+ symporter
VVLPLRKTAMTPAQHIWMLRLAVTGVAAFAFFFSTVFTPTEYINLWWNLTGAMFTAGAGAAIIGGLYWRKGTTSAAWAAAITGSVCAVLGIVITSFWPRISQVTMYLLADVGVNVQLPARFWINQQVCAFLAVVIAAVVYMVVSLLTSRQLFNLDKMLHRGKYAIEADGGQPTMALRERFRLRNILKFDNNFTRLDKITAGGIFWWAMAMLIINVVITVWNVFSPWQIAWWANYWMATAVIVPCIIAVITLVWFGIGGTIDMRDFFYTLRTMKRDARDDGRVVAEHNLIDESPAAARATAAEPIKPAAPTLARATPTP